MSQLLSRLYEIILATRLQSRTEIWDKQREPFCRPVGYLQGTKLMLKKKTFRLVSLDNIIEIQVYFFITGNGLSFILMSFI